MTSTISAKRPQKTIVHCKRKDREAVCVCVCGDIEAERLCV